LIPNAAEMFLTFGLTMTVIMTLVEKNKTTVLAPLAIGIALFATQMAGIQYTGAAVNTGKYNELAVKSLLPDLG
jgi:aquaporin related protein